MSASAPTPVAAVAKLPPQMPTSSSNKATNGDPVASRLAAGRELVGGATNARYSVQLMVTEARSRGYLESYLAEAGKSVPGDRLFLVPFGPSETPRIAVLFGGFREQGEAIGAMAAFRPYVRTIDGVREDVRRAERP
jgi:hypothetical protein